ncbi:MAG: carboxypeptidase-like regulatory domain-containing protein [Chitinophagaceae bacterium]|nr:carboxypeptidase-like regulatory domain-containing protein [Chitinophagaceae bacterium]
MKKLLLVFFIFASIHSSAQKIYGTVFSDKGDLLPYASVTIKGTSIGTSANNKAKFSFAVAPGTYTVVCQHIGYKTQEKNITVTNEDAEITFIISAQQLDMTEVVVKSGEDPAYEIIRQAIKKRSFYSEQVKGFECGLYTKDMMKLRKLPKKILGRKIEDADVKDMGLDSSRKGIIYLSESVARIYSQQPDKFKMEVISSRVSGSDGFGFTFPTFISFYQNNVSVFLDRLNPRGFVSPIADAAISMYKFKYLGSFYEDGKEINSIQVIPRRNYEPAFTGVINITDGDWRIHSLDLLLTKKAHLEIVDTLHITQFHVPVGNDVWRVKNQHINFGFKQFGVDAIGNFVSVYSDYKINPVFAKNRFNNVVVKYDTASNKKPVAYWDSIRPMPLELEERMDYQVKDSLFLVNKDSIQSQASVDSMNKKQGKLKLYDIFWKGLHRTKYTVKGNHQWGVESLIQNLEYNTVEGIVLNVNPYYNRYFKKIKTNFSFEPNLRYGFNNGHLNAWADMYFRTRDWETDKKIKRQTWTISGGKRVSQFNKANPITPLTNTVNTLLWGDNFMKIYENYFGSINFSKRYETGLRFNVNVLYEDRIPLENTTDFVIFKRDSANWIPNYPIEKIPSQFTPHQAFVVSFDVSIKPGQKYIQYPNRKMSLGSNYPTFSFNYTKGIKNIFGSDVNFDKWRISVSDDKNFKLAGLLKYKIGIGGFLNSKSVFIQDYQHFTGNRSTRASEYVNSFQMAHYYIYSTTSSFYAYGHLEHHFNGLITNKIPLFKRLNWNLVAGSNALYVNKLNNHVEVFAGLENLIKIFRVDLLVSYRNGSYERTGIRIGAGGILGGSLSASNSRSRRSSISL